MGRTMPTHRMAIEQLSETLRPYSKTLRSVDQVALDQLLDAARHRAAAASMLPDFTPLESALLSMLVAHQAALEQLRRALLSAEGNEGPRRWELDYKQRLAQYHAPTMPPWEDHRPPSPP